ncbi:MAG: M56 family metallopeptidase [Acidobacteriota bacterium]
MMKVSLIVSLGLAATALLRRRSAAVRHWVLAVTIACAAATPLLELVVPSWHVPVDSAWLGRSAEPLTLFIPIRMAQADEAAGPASNAGAAPARSLTAARALGMVWMAGTAVSLLLLLVGLARLAWLASGSSRVEHGAWTELTARLSRDYGLRRPVLLLRSSHPTLLATWGLRPPKVILPPDAFEWPEDRVRIVLGHELAHVLRRDWLVQVLAELLRAVYWFNPLVWIVVRRLRQESEQACDDAVLGLGVNGPEYATHLLAVARAFKGYEATVFPAPAMARPSSLERRVSAMLNTRLNRTPITWCNAVAIVIALVCLTLPLAGLVASAQTATATFSGSLIDAVGRILPNVALVLTSARTKQKYEAQSDEAGHFALTGLPAGEYQLGARLPGFDTSQGRLTLAAGQVLDRDVALQIGGIQETVSISSKEIPTAPRAARQVAQSDFDRCSQVTTGGCIKPPLRIADARPRYPQAHVASGTSGKVEVDGRIGTDGFIKDFRVLAPADPDFASATVEALRLWQFTQVRLDGVPVEANIHVLVNFVVE